MFHLYVFILSLDFNGFISVYARTTRTLNKSLAQRCHQRWSLSGLPVGYPAG